MKDFVMIWNRLAGRRYSNVNTGQNQNSGSSADEEEMTIAQKTETIRRKSSVVVNRLFNAALSPVHSADSTKWPKSK